ncbi:Hypothetical protein A7982_09917 [Minicystis rosea]|nr:Hypothetical protein A7982_09917 [Minicystis rosea]
MAPRPTRILHFTEIDNLNRIVAAGEVQCTADLRAAGTDYRSIALANIQDRRGTTIVPCGPRGCLHEYVPFYFAPRSPMLYLIKCGGVAGVSPQQERIVYLVSSVEAVQAAGLPFVFTDGHATMTLTDFFMDLERLDAIDWPLMRAKYWNDTATDGDRKRRRQAEALVHRRMPWHLVEEVVVKTARADAAVRASLTGAAHIPTVRIDPSWYFDGP